MSYDNVSVTVELFSEKIMPEIGLALLKRLTRKEFDNRMRVSHKMISSGTILGNPIRPIDRIISCYLVEK